MNNIQQLYNHLNKQIVSINGKLLTATASSVNNPELQKAFNDNDLFVVGRYHGGVFNVLVFPNIVTMTKAIYELIDNIAIDDDPFLIKYIVVKKHRHIKKVSYKNKELFNIVEFFNLIYKYYGSENS